MYPLQCHAGFNVPARAGKFDIVGFTATVEDNSADAYIGIVDDENIDQSGKAGLLIDSLEPPTEYKNILVNKHFDAKAADTGDVDTIEWFPPECIKTRFGTSICFTNIKQGSFCLYVR